MGLENGQKLMMWDSPYAINTTTRGYHLGMVLTRTHKNGDDFGMVPFCTMPGQARPPKMGAFGSNFSIWTAVMSTLV